MTFTSLSDNFEVGDMVEDAIPHKNSKKFLWIVIKKNININKNSDWDLNYKYSFCVYSPTHGCISPNCYLSNHKKLC